MFRSASQLVSILEGLEAFSPVRTFTCARMCLCRVSLPDPPALTGRNGTEVTEHPQVSDSRNNTMLAIRVTDWHATPPARRPQVDSCGVNATRKATMMNLRIVDGRQTPALRSKATRLLSALLTAHRQQKTRCFVAFGTIDFARQVKARSRRAAFCHLSKPRTLDRVALVFAVGGRVV